VSAQRYTEVGEDELPLCCPRPRAGGVWNLHPRVFLPLSGARPQIACPYCGARYVLKSPAVASGKAAKEEAP
jgi:uncharacterized Zn-finger protein